VGRALSVLRVPSFAKVNLGLEVVGARPDGYHDLRTIFQTIDLHDDVELRSPAKGISVRCDHPKVPSDATNLAHRAAAALAETAKIDRGVAITITKRIPVAGGMGGGSSNAAAVLIGLDRMWRLGLGRSGLHPIAERLGADVPFFLVGGTALGLGRGDEVHAVLPQLRAHVVVVDTGRPVSTAAVFRRMDAGLTHTANANKIFRFVSSQLEGLEDAFPILSNDLERAALEEDPELGAQVRDIRGILIREGAVFASLSGSGGTYFGIFSEAAPARRACSSLEKGGFRAIRGRTLSLDRYRRMLGPAPLAPAGGRGSNRGRSGQHGDHGRQGHSRGR
jgi:4-diphosphocytidyl-2-C-methyl-D-erythritol kinase